MKPELRGIGAKLDRAVEHLQALDKEVREFIEGKTHSVTGEFEPETDCYVFKMQVHKRPRLRTGVLLGDVMHNLRSALDHLVWQLVVKTNVRPGRHTRFPLYDDPGKFADSVTTPGQRGKINPLWGLEGTPAWQAIKDLQPYQRGDDQGLLGALHDLSNEDKHRVVLQAVTGVREPTSIHDLGLALNADAGKILRTVLIVGVPLEDGTDVVRVHLAPTGPDPQVIMKGSLTLDIAFGERQILGEFLPEIAGATMRVVDDFQSRFF